MKHEIFLIQDFRDYYFFDCNKDRDAESYGHSATIHKLGIFCDVAAIVVAHRSNKIYIASTWLDNEVTNEHTMAVRAKLLESDVPQDKLSSHCVTCGELVIEHKMFTTVESIFHMGGKDAVREYFTLNES